MPRGAQRQRRSADVIGNAVYVMKVATGEIAETDYDRPAKRKTGVAGARARNKVLAPERRAGIARVAAAARWADDGD